MLDSVSRPTLIMVSCCACAGELQRTIDWMPGALSTSWSMATRAALSASGTIGVISSKIRSGIVPIDVEIGEAALLALSR